MLNHKTIFKQKSKILLIILSIFGLAFSYSCSCRSPEAPKGDPTVFSISTSSVETRLVQKADGSGFNYQPSIKFSEANGNQFTVSYEVTDNDIANKIEKANITYNEKDGLITFDKTAVLDKLKTSKKSITITFTVKANDMTLQNPETNFTINVDLKKTLGTLDVLEVIGKTLVQDVGSFSINNGTFEFFYNGIKTTQTSSSVRANPPTGSDSFSVSKQNFKTDALANMKTKNDEKTEDKKIPYSKVEFLDNDADAGGGTHSFYLKFYFSDEDYDLDEDQKNGIDYRIDVEGGQMDDGQGGKKDKLTWI